MMHKINEKKLFIISLIGFLMASATIWLLPFVNYQKDKGIIIATLIGIFFWFGVLGGIIFFLLAWYKVKKTAEYQKIRQTEKAGCFNFFKNRIAMIIDILMIVSWMLTIISNYFIVMPDVLVLLLMFLALYTLFLHFMLNGRVYSYIFERNISKRKGDRG